MKVLLDTNVVLDLLLQRDPWRVQAEAIAEAGAAARIQPFVSASSITDIYYISRKLVGTEQARHVVRSCLDSLEIIAVTRDLLVAAERRSGRDFEDNLQIECAVAAGLEAIITRNTQDFADSPVQCLTPAELVSYLTPPYESVSEGSSQ